MNLKKAKSLRKYLRLNGVAIGQRIVAGVKMNRRAVPDGFTENGKPKAKTFHYTGTERLDSQCGRAIYQAHKRGIQAAHA